MQTRIDHPLERLVFFSDAVFAIAITLLIIEIHPPELGGSTAEALTALVDLAPKFFSFVLSFLVIGRFWIGHHSAFAAVARFSPRMLWPNLMLLMAIAAMPFASAFLGENLGQLVPTLVYNGFLLLTAILSARLIALATSPEFARTDFLDRDRLIMRSRGVGVIFGAALAFAATFLTPIFSQVALISIPLFQIGVRRWLLRADQTNPAPENSGAGD